MDEKNPTPQKNIVNSKFEKTKNSQNPPIDDIYREIFGDESGFSLEEFLNLDIIPRTPLSKEEIDKFMKQQEKKIIEKR